jgi:hypothetical protein
MDFANPQYRGEVLERDSVMVQGQNYPDLISFTSGKIQDSLSIAGIPKAKLYAEAKPMGMQLDSANADFIVRVLDVYPDGRQMYVFEGAVNARARKYAAARAKDGIEDPGKRFSNIVPDSIYEFSFQMMPIGYTFGHGHKVKVLISNTNYPRYQANPNVPLEFDEFHRRKPNDGQAFNYYGQNLMARKALHRFSFSQVHQGHIELPVLGQQVTVSREDQQPAPTAWQQLRVRAYPNPPSHQLHIDFQGSGHYNLRIMNAMGQTLHRQQVKGEHTQLPVAHLAAGVYYLQVNDNSTGTTRTRKIMIR